MAAVDQFVIKIKGKQSHGAYPHLSVDPIVIGSQAVMALQTIRSRNLPALEPSVVTVGVTSTVFDTFDVATDIAQVFAILSTAGFFPSSSALVK